MANELSTFLTESEGELELFLEELEKKTKELFPHYPPRPEELAFRRKASSGIVQRFAHAIRINPELPLVLYRQAHPKTPCGKHPPYRKPSVFGVDFLKNYRYCRLKVGERISPLEVLVAASDEPDHGLDIGLFEDNGSRHSRLYGFGPQPFGDPRLIYSSQAPFHMGFYHEARLVFWAAPFLKKTYPEVRIFQFRELSRFAFRQKNPYWGYRFLGWALHYLTDLTQPYHATVLPGVSLWRMLWINFLALLGFPRAKEEAINLVSNRHTALEEYQWRVQKELLEKAQYDHILIKAFAAKEFRHPLAYFPYYPSQVVAKEAWQRSSILDNLLVEAFPQSYVLDPSFSYTDENKALLMKTIVELGRIHEREKLDEELVYLFENFGAHSRFFVESALQEFFRENAL